MKDLRAWLAPVDQPHENGSYFPDEVLAERKCPLNLSQDPKGSFFHYKKLKL
jgi:hypothetical protein